MAKVAGVIMTRTVMGQMKVKVGIPLMNFTLVTFPFRKNAGALPNSFLNRPVEPR